MRSPCRWCKRRTWTVGWASAGRVRFGACVTATRTGRVAGRSARATGDGRTTVFAVVVYSPFHNEGNGGSDGGGGHESRSRSKKKNGLRGGGRWQTWFGLDSRTSDNASNPIKHSKFTFSVYVRESMDRYSTIHKRIGVTLVLFLLFTLELEWMVSVRLSSMATRSTNP